MLGQCSPEIVEAAKFLRDLLFSKTSEDYRKGDPNAVFGRNEGVIHHFNELTSKYPEMAEFLPRQSKQGPIAGIWPYG